MLNPSMFFERNTTRKEASLIPFITEKFHYASPIQNQNNFFRLQNLHGIEETGNVKDTSNKQTAVTWAESDRKEIFGHLTESEFVKVYGLALGGGYGGLLTQAA